MSYTQPGNKTDFQGDTGARPIKETVGIVELVVGAKARSVSEGWASMSLFSDGCVRRPVAWVKHRSHCFVELLDVSLLTFAWILWTSIAFRCCIALLALLSLALLRIGLLALLCVVRLCRALLALLGLAVLTSSSLSKRSNKSSKSSKSNSCVAVLCIACTALCCCAY